MLFEITEQVSLSLQSDRHTEEMKNTGINTIPCRSLCLSASVVILLAGCAMPGSFQQTCTVRDPDLVTGVYSGGCKDGLADGYGEVSGAGNYRGDFRAGKKHGKGIKVMPNGDRYAGDFDEDYRHGKGVYVWGPDTPWAGDRYEGDYRRDLRHGWGIFQWGNGDRYEGQWRDDLRLGLSVMEVRRAAWAGANGKVAKGMQVCTTVRLGLNHYQQIQGAVEDVIGNRAAIRITGMEGTRASLQGRMVRVGDLVEGESAGWKSCGK